MVEARSEATSSRLLVTEERIITQFDAASVASLEPLPAIILPFPSVPVLPRCDI